MSQLLQKIEKRGHWRVVVRPGRFAEKRVSNLLDLYPMMLKSSVQFRGWDYPRVEPQEKLKIGVDYISQEVDWEYHLELWRIYQSGQFVHYSGFTEDWLDKFRLSAAPTGLIPGKSLSVLGVVFRFTEIFEFAARLASTDAGDEQMGLDITLRGLKSRSLWMDPSRVDFPWKGESSITEFPYQVQVSRTQLLTENRDLALKPAVELFRRFNWEPRWETLGNMQTDLVKTRSSVTAADPPK